MGEYPNVLRVMLVDDHPVVRAGYRRLLELESDLQVVAEHGDVDTALEALADLPAGGLQVVVVDLAMPRRSGLDLLREVGQRHPAIRVLVFSMHDNAAIVAEALRLGAAGFVTKGSAPEELVQCVRRVMAERAPVLSSDLAARHVLQQHRDEEPLTLKEMEVLRLLAAGDSVQAIAEALQLSPKTVSNYQTVLKHKLGAGTAIELLRHARERGYVA
ncbi:DNA-binding response regulator in two-component regulatory system wtih UhpB [Rubrivivax sp. A210]|uniref:response regulator transcription factor n=1 Tax=Rubrivivax sp. A210 TaxID=2772301 RepID=UPI001919089B|nr:response regulator transcription factor [Rubrivivax sp. A210]CAD5367003.1 DNA-binding response regulator in two-component regulatory system wtih UhpB [Rubrivivax sp. A210]